MVTVRPLDNGTRLIGWLWLLMAPALVLMALISTVRSETAYWVQLAAFSSVAAVGVVAGIAAGLRYRWGARVLHVLSWIGFSYFAGCGLLAALYTVAAGNSLLIGAFVIGFLGAPALAFGGIAVALRSGLRSTMESSGES